MIQENTSWQKSMMQKIMPARKMAKHINDLLQVIGIHVAYEDDDWENFWQRDRSVCLKKIDDSTTKVHVELVGDDGIYYVRWNRIAIPGIDSLENCTYYILNKVSRFVFLKNGKAIGKKENPYLGCSSLEEAMIRKDLIA